MFKKILYKIYNLNRQFSDFKNAFLKFFDLKMRNTESNEKIKKKQIYLRQKWDIFAHF